MDATQLMNKFKEYIEMYQMPELLEADRVGSLFFEIDYKSIAQFDMELAEQILDTDPSETIRAIEIVIGTFDLNNKDKWQVLIKNIPKSRNIPLNEISDQLNRIYTFEGIVMKPTDIHLKKHKSRFECSACFPKGTQVMTPKGYKNIEDVDIVSCVDSNLNLRKRHAKVIPTGKKTIWEIHYNGKIIECSGNHKWFVLRNGMIRVIQTKHLNKSDYLLKIHDKKQKLKRKDMYNLSEKIYPTSFLRQKWSFKNIKPKNLFQRLQEKALQSFSNRWRKNKIRQQRNNKVIHQRENISEENSKNARNLSEINFTKVKKIQCSNKVFLRFCKEWNKQFGKETVGIPKETSKSLLQAWKTMWVKKERRVLQKFSEAGIRISLREMWDMFPTLCASQGFKPFQQQFRKSSTPLQILPYEITLVNKKAEKVDMYDLQVPDYHNFLLEDNIITHNCGNIIPILMPGRVELKPKRCGCGAKSGFREISKEFIKFQVFELIESFDEVPEIARKPIRKQVLITENLTRKEINGKLQPGQKVKVTGWLDVEQMKSVKGKPSNEYKTFVIANNIELIDRGWKSLILTKSQKNKCKLLAQSKTLLDDFAQSMSPTFEGYELLRKSLILQHVGGKRIFDKNGNLDEREIIHILLSGGPGCQPKGSKVLMANGKFKEIQDIIEGDLVLSPQDDGSYSFSEVLETNKWFCNEIYEVYSNRVKSKKLYSCSNNHLIPVKYRKKEYNIDGSYINKQEIRNYTAEELSKVSEEKLQHNKIGFFCPEIKEFKTDFIECEIEPYCLGAYLGDGYFRTIQGKTGTETNILNFCTSDLEVIDYINKIYPYISSNKESKATAYRFSTKSNFALLLKKYNLQNKKSGDKFIPESAKYSSLEYRRKLLAGILDTDGYCNGNNFDYITKSKQLAEDLQFLVHSVGGIATISKCIKGIKSTGFKGNYYRLFISIDTKFIPLKLKRRYPISKGTKLSKNRIAIKSVNSKKGDYVYGITLESKSNLYVTDNYMVTHNTGKTSNLKRSITISPLWNWADGKGLTAAGLVACISKDEYGGYTLDAGPLVMADGGIIGLDELDKLDKSHFGSLNSAMNDEKTKITKANIDQMLNTRTSILATANPKHKDFVDSESITDQLAPIPKDILDRFDLIWIMTDKIDKDKMDKKYMARHDESAELNQPIYDLKQIRLFISYAKRLIPILQKKEANYFSKCYREFTGKTNETSDSKRIRGNLLRLVYAYSKFYGVGSENEKNQVNVTEDAINFCFELMKASFKSLRILNEQTQTISYETLEGIPTKKEINKYYLVRDIIKKHRDQCSNQVPEDLILIEANKEVVMDINDLDTVIEKLKKNSEVFEPKRGKWGLL